MPLCFIVDRQRGDASHNNDHNTSRSPAPSVIFPRRHKRGKKRENVPELHPFFIVASRYCALAEAPADGSVRRVFRSALEIKASIFTASGEELVLMSAAVRVPFHPL